jgi:VWFA-related protein
VRRFIPLVFVVLVTGIAVPAAQQPTEAPPPQAVFRATTALVEVDVTVLDGRRQPVKDLTAADFTVLEDGQPREVETFAAVDLADRVVTTDAAWMSEVPRDVADNQIAVQEGRLVVILMDRSIPVGFPTTVARQVATAAVEELGPGDMGALVSTSGGVPQNFTTDRARLIRTINQRDWSTGSAGEHSELMDSVGPEGTFTELTDGRCLCGLCVHQTITNVATALEDLPRRRKSILFVGSNFILQAGPQLQQSELDCGRKLEDSRKVMFAALDRSGVTVHSIDPSGLQTVGPTNQASSTIAARRGVGAVREAQLAANSAQLQDQGELRVLPDRTGGRAVMNTNGPQERVPEIIRESQSYYLIGFRPGDVARPGQPRSIEVKVNRRGVNVHARRQVVFPSPSRATDAAASVPGAAASSALNGLLPNAHLPMDLNVAAFAAPGSPRAVVTVSAGVNAFAPGAGAVAAGEPIEIVAAAYDHTGRPQASARQTLELSWPPAEANQPRRVDVLSRLDLPPGDYEIRVAASAAGGARAASVFTHLTVPSFSDARLSLSNIVMSAPATTNSAPPAFLASVLPLRPTPQRTFRRADQSTAFVRVYQGTSRTDGLEPVQVRVRIVDAQDRDVRDEVLVLQPSAFATGRTADLRMPLPLASLAAGDYLLRLEAATAEQVAGRAVRFSVE